MAQEKQFENKVKKYLTEKGCYWVKHFGCAFSRAGVPDLLCCVNGKFVALECKSEKGKLSELQKYEIKKISNSGGFAYCVSPNNWEEIKKEIDKILNL